MGKDKEGKIHPRKGKPSGSMRQGAGLQSIPVEAVDHQMEIAEKYTEGEEPQASNIYLRR